MLRYETKTRPGLVALYDIRPGNGAGQFLEPRSLHGAVHEKLPACITGTGVRGGGWRAAVNPSTHTRTPF